MPFLAGILPILTAVGSLAGAGVGIGEAVANSGGGAPTTPTTPTPTPPSTNQLLQQKQLIGTQDSNIQSQTGGTAGDFYQLLQSQLQAGTLGQPGSQGNAQQFQSANNSPTSTVANGQVPNLSDFLSSFSG